MRNFLVDSHCHLNYDGLYERLNDVLQNADNANVKILQTICTQMDEVETLRLIANTYKNVFYSVGVHPLNVYKSDVISVNEIIKTCNADTKISGIGETGLDYYKANDLNILQLQRESFNNHICAAQVTGLPLIIHTRNAEDDTYELLQNGMYKHKFTGVLHCFTGSCDLAEKAVKMGLYISASGIITFKNSEEVRNVFKVIPMNRILIETDAPFLAPIPYRGRINQPSYVVEVAKELSKIKHMSYDEIVRITTSNFLNLFNKVMI